jgi:carbon-monoxide dehydrogenase medium subunit
MIPAAVDYLRAGSLEEALDALADPDARALAGGHSLLPLMKLRLARPSLLVDLGRLGLREIEERGGEVRIGALATWEEIARSPSLSGPLAALAESAAAVGDLQVRNRGTVGGALAHADPAADVRAPLLALDARAILRSPAGEQEVPVEDFLRGPFETALGRQELIVAVVVPQPAGSSGSAYVAFKDPASGYPLAGAAALVGNGEVRTGLTGVATGDDAYVRHLADVAVRRAVEEARRRAR